MKPFPGDFRKAWGTAGKLAGVEILFHDLRRSAARNMEMGGMLRESAKKITGHRTDIMYQRYAGVTSTKDMVDAGKTMERFFESQQPIEKRLKIN